MLINNFLKIHIRLMLVSFRLVLVSTTMMDSHHHHGVWKTVAISKAISHVYCVPTLLHSFAFFLIMRASLPAIVSSPLHRLQQPTFLFQHFLFQHLREHHSPSPSKLLVASFTISCTFSFIVTIKVLLAIVTSFTLHHLQQLLFLFIYYFSNFSFIIFMSITLHRLLVTSFLFCVPFHLLSSQELYLW